MNRIAPPIPGVPDLATLSQTDLIAVKEVLVGDIQRIQQKLTRHATMTPAERSFDPEWRARAVRALRIKELQLRDVKAALRALHDNVETVLQRVWALQRTWKAEGRPEAAELAAALHRRRDQPPHATQEVA